MNKWRCVDTMPVGKRIEVLTWTGIVCPARVSGFAGDRLYVRPASAQYPKRRVACLRTDKSGDVSAVAWRPLERATA